MQRLFIDMGVKLIERTVCAIIRPKEEDEEPRLRFITGGMLSTAELSILQARKEIHLLQNGRIGCLAWYRIFSIRIRMMILIKCSAV